MNENNNDFMQTILQALPDNIKNTYNNMKMDLLENSPTLVFPYDVNCEESFSNPNTLAALYIMSDIKILDEFIAHSKLTIKLPDNYNEDYDTINYVIYIDNHHLMEMSYFVFACSCLMSKAMAKNATQANSVVRKAIEKFFTYTNGFTFYDNYCYEITNLIEDNLPCDNMELQHNALEIYKRMKIILKVLPFIPYGIIDEYAKKAVEYFKTRISETNSIIELVYNSIINSLNKERGDKNEPEQSSTN